MYNPKNKCGPGFTSIRDDYPIFIESPSFIGGICNECYEDELVFKFSVSVSIDSQLKKLKNEMEKRAKELLKNKISNTLRFKTDKKLYITCLRILDALKEEANDEDIIYFIYSFMFNKDNYPKSPDDLKVSNYSKGNDNVFDMETKRKRLKNNKAKAKELSDFDYKSLLKTTSYDLDNVKK
jgi:hypothetical protein